MSELAQKERIGTREKFLLLALIFYLPLSGRIGALPFLPGLLNLTNALIIAIFVLVIRNQTLSIEKFRWKDNPFYLPMILFLGWNILSLLQGFLYGPEYIFSAASELWRKWGTPFAIFFLTYNLLREEKDWKAALRIVMLVSGLIALKACFDYVIEDDRIGGIFGDPNILAAFLVYTLFLPASFFLFNWQRIMDWMWLAPALAGVRGLMVTFSRGGYISFVAALGLAAFLRSRILFALFAVLVAATVLHPALLPAGVRHRLGETFSKPPVQEADVEKNLDPSARYRVEIWNGALEMIKEDPLTGVGYNLFEAKIPHYWREGISMDAHDTYLLVSAESGIPAGLLFAFMIFMAGWNGLRLYFGTQDKLMKTAALGFLAGWAGFVCSNFYVNELDRPEVSGYFWILAALIMRMRAGNEKS